MKTVSRTYTMGARAESVAGTSDRIALAAMALFLAEPFEDVTLLAIASAAGVSHQTVLNHFESKEGVVGAVAEIIAADTVAARGAAMPGDDAGALRALLGEYERMGDANVRWVAAAERFPVLVPYLEGGRQSHREWLVNTFGDRLPAARSERRRAVNALHAATDVCTWKLLRRDLDLSRPETERTIAALVAGVLEGATR
jgi:AcrR family transcriptional regulator